MFMLTQKVHLGKYKFVLLICVQQSTFYKKEKKQEIARLIMLMNNL